MVTLERPKSTYTVVGHESTQFVVSRDQALTVRSVAKMKVNGACGNENCLDTSTSYAKNMSMQLERWSFKTGHLMPEKMYSSLVALIKSYKSFDTIKLAREGVRTELLVEFAEELSIGEGELCNYLQIPIASFVAARAAGIKLGKNETDKMLRALSIYRLAIDVFDDSNIAALWMVTSIESLNQQTPASLLDTDSGVRLVRDVLLRLEYGMAS